MRDLWNALLQESVTSFFGFAYETGVIDGAAYGSTFLSILRIDVVFSSCSDQLAVRSSDRRLFQRSRGARPSRTIFLGSVSSLQQKGKSW